MFTFIHAADIHLDSPLKGLERYEGAPVEEIRGATRRALTNLVELAVDREVGFVLIAGDLYDGDWRDHNTGLFFAKQVTRLRDANIPVYVVSGNHDAANKMTKSLRLPKNSDGSAVLLSHKQVETVEPPNLGVAIHGRGFVDACITESVVGQYPPARSGLFNIGMLHTSLETESENEHARYAPCRVADLAAKEYDYWALGHIHQRSVHHEHPWISFSGNIQGRHGREVGAKGCHFVTVDDRGRAQMKFEPLDVFRWEHCQVDARGIEDTDAVLECFATELARLDEKHGHMPLAVRVSISGRFAAHERMAGDSVHWTNQLRAAAVDVANGRIWIEKVHFSTSPIVSLEQSVADDGPIRELLKHIDELRADDELAAPMLRDLEELYGKLPGELKHGAEGIDWTAAGKLRDLLSDVEPLLIGRLLGQED